MKRKNVIIYFVIVCILAGTTYFHFENNGYASGQTVKIVVDGKQITPTDANGKRVDPIIIDGTTYLPVRAVADALGKEVYWDGPSYTVYLGKMDGKLEYPSLYLKDAVSISKQPIETNNLTDNYENHYTNAIHNWGSTGNSYEYLLNMKYTRFKGTLYVPYGESADWSGYFKVIADGKIIYTSPEITKTSAPINFNVNITGCNHLEIEFSEYKNSFNNNIEICLGNAGFYQ